MFLGNQYRLLLWRARLLLQGHVLAGLNCSHFNLAFICVLSSKHFCHGTAIPSSGLCLDKENKWFGTHASRVGMSKFRGSELQAAKLGLRTPNTPFLSIWLSVCPRTWTHNPSTAHGWVQCWKFESEHKHSNFSHPQHLMLNFSAVHSCLDWDPM